jgi:hypothetical protein
VAGWDQVKWTKARQVADLMKLDASFLEDPKSDPETGYRKLREKDLAVAVRYLGFALPRLEAVSWAAHLLDGWSRSKPPCEAQRQALDSVCRWLEEPTDEYRRAAHEAGERARADSPERMLADAVFMSGGSISQPDLPAVQPPQHACGGFAAVAVLAGAYGTPSPADALAAACDVGEKVAALGVKALSSP